MNQPPLSAPPPYKSRSNQPLLWGALVAAVTTLFFIFRHTLAWMTQLWETPEYSHGYMIPIVAIYLLWQRLNQLPAAATRGSWWGLVLLICGIGAFFVGELASIRTFSQYGFLLSLLGIIFAFFGRKNVRVVWAAFAYLVFMIPLPSFLFATLSSHLQLISSQIGVAVIRLFNISVNLEGNVIDLGAMQLQVAEACSGLRYLFPLASFGFLIGYIYRGKLWQRVLLFLSSIPITILMNSFRIGLIGVSVDYWGIAMAEGVLHDFEGWVVFIGCLGILFLEIYCFKIFSQDEKPALDRLNLNTPALTLKFSDFQLDGYKQRPFILSFVLLLALVIPLTGLNERTEIVLNRQSLTSFPLFHKNWVGRSAPLDQKSLDILKLTDYSQINYQNQSLPNSLPVNFYVAWYASQKYGIGIHSPAVCIPGGGWKILSAQQHTLANVQHKSGKPLRVNRIEIEKDHVIQLVYYWMEGRDRNITTEYAAIWFHFWDSLTRSRSDGALVRLVAFVPDPSQIAAADHQLEQFAQDFYPLLPSYTP